MATILIALDSYDEVFSDFDVREYHSRALSQDFLDELKARYRNVGKVSKIVLTLPKKRRKKSVEPLVVNRIRKYFEHKLASASNKKKKTLLWALAYFLMGALTFGILINLPEQFDWVYDFALFPAWYLSWVGLDKLRAIPSIDSRARYYEAVLNADIHFEDEEKYEDR